jgi:hypothetical protein
VVRRLIVVAAILALGLAIGTADAARPLSGAVYAGKTQQKQPIRFAVSSSGKRVRGLRVTVLVVCKRGTLTSGRRMRFRQASDFIAVHRDGTFSGYTRVRPAPGSTIRSGRFILNGRFRTRRRATGSLLEKVRLAGGLRCNSGEIHFAVRAR